jgi:hypothetical protein
MKAYIAKATIAIDQREELRASDTFTLTVIPGGGNIRTQGNGLMRFTFIATTLFAALSSTAAPASPEEWWSPLRRLDAQWASIPTCSEFMTRLNEAGRVLTPPFKFELDINSSKSEPVLFESFWLTYTYRGEDTNEGVLDCVDGKFSELQLDTLVGFGKEWQQPQRSADLAAALIYAYTAYPVANVTEAARMLVANKPKSLADAAHPAMIYLTWHAEISLNYSLINMTSGICNDKLFPTICPTAPAGKVHFKRFPSN